MTGSERLGTADESVSLRVEGPIAIITINRPSVRNAIDLPTAESISLAFDTCETQTSIRAIVLTGANGYFSAGMDLKALNATGDRPITKRRGAFGIVEKPPNKPLIAAVEGHALGGGLEIALAADLIVASETARFGLPEVKRGLVATAGGVLRLPQRIPRAIALELVLTGEAISAGIARDLGLVNRVVPEGTALDAALELASVIAANAPMAVRAAKRVVVESAQWPSEEGFTRQREYTDPVRASRDAREGAQAFVEKRSPQWQDA